MRPFYAWVAVAYFPAYELVSAPTWGGALGLAVVVAAYLLSIRLGSWPLLVLLAVAALSLGLAYGGKWLYLLPLVSIACGVVVRGRALPYALAAITVASMAVTLLAGGGEDGVAAVAWGTFIAGVVVHLTMRLSEARQELAREAVSRERERFSRDLHDLLGHTLSLVVVKAEAVRRLAPRDPGAAAAQAADIEEIGRRALSEVRAAVAGYRGRGMADEMAAARLTLEEAGVRAEVDLEEVRLPPDADTLLGWAVREGVTNVIRHARATTCAITVRGEDGRVVLEIVNDGAGASFVRGNGLKGLAERGAEVDAAARGGSFTLRVAVPA
ncbi:sensor histidine kinase [Nonomuraea sp. NPDC059194]|uniref:sensor histidine kinase n=1 Tax=Nonomuraea sp. NPDC059194 TaxID=3346764 RepID=UPI003687C952